MKIREYFLKALNHGAYKERHWVISVLSLTDESFENGDWTKNPYPFRLVRRDDGLFFFIDLDKNGDFTQIEVNDIHKPLVNPSYALHLEPGDLPNVHNPVDTTYGDALANAMILCYAFDNKFPYVNGKFNPKKIEKYIEERFADDLEVGELEDPEKLYVNEYKRFAEAIFNLPSYNSLFVPSASPKTMTRDPRIVELRARLVAEAGERITDPAVVARIDIELGKMDRSWVDDDGKDFYIADKAYNNVRKKVFLLHGYEKPFSENDDPVTITTSLDEGWDYDNLPAMNNSAREGSYFRGSETQLGGVKAKEALRNFQNFSIREPDSGDTHGIAEFITEENKNDMLGFFYISKTGPVLITEENVGSLMNKWTAVRSPSACKTPFTDYCETCMGVKIAQNPKALSAYASAVGSTFLSASMKKMHVTNLKLAEYDLDPCIS